VQLRPAGAEGLSWPRLATLGCAESQDPLPHEVGAAQWVAPLFPRSSTDVNREQSSKPLAPSWLCLPSPKTYPGLDYGDHNFEVYAFDGAGNPDPTPASYSWMINRVIFVPLIMR
jgi:hypothetical protein